MNIKIKEIVSNVENIKELQSIKLPIKISYKLSKLIGKIQPELDIYNEKRDELVKEYGDKQEDDTFKVTDPNKIKSFIEKINDLVEIEVEIDFEPIDIEDLGDISIPPKNLISWIFK